MRTILTVGMMAGLLASVTLAEEKKRPGGHPEERPPLGEPDKMFKAMDRDKDGKISKIEFFAIPRIEQLPEEKREEIFERLDRDGDGFLVQREIRAMQHDARRRMRDGLRKLDTDASGGVSFEEFSKGKGFAKLPEAKRRQIFERMDADGNGEINAEDKPKGPPERRHPERKIED